MTVVTSDDVLVGHVGRLYVDEGEDAGGLEARRPNVWVEVERVPDGQGGKLYVPLNGFIRIGPDKLTLDANKSELDNRIWTAPPEALDRLIARDSVTVEETPARPL